DRELCTLEVGGRAIADPLQFRTTGFERGAHLALGKDRGGCVVELRVSARTVLLAGGERPIDRHGAPGVDHAVGPAAQLEVVGDPVLRERGAGVGILAELGEALLQAQLLLDAAGIRGRGAAIEPDRRSAWGVEAGPRRLRKDRWRDD